MSNFYRRIQYALHDPFHNEGRRQTISVDRADLGELFHHFTQDDARLRAEHLEGNLPDYSPEDRRRHADEILAGTRYRTIDWAAYDPRADQRPADPAYMHKLGRAEEWLLNLKSSDPNINVLLGLVAATRRG